MATALTTIFVATIGVILGFVANNYLATRNLKKEISLKVAEYRLQWINNLGDQFAIFVSQAIGLAASGITTDKEAYDEAAREIFRSSTRIRLLMNLSDPDYDQLDKLLTNMELVALTMSNGDLTSAAEKERLLADSRPKFVALTNSILKREWQRTKDHLREDTVKVSALRSDRNTASD